jgi:hypothetical protein
MVLTFQLDSIQDSLGIIHCCAIWTSEIRHLTETVYSTLTMICKKPWELFLNSIFVNILQEIFASRDLRIILHIEACRPFTR